VGVSLLHEVYVVANPRSMNNSLVVNKIDARKVKLTAGKESKVNYR
jgi:hypothetical protein